MPTDTSTSTGSADPVGPVLAPISSQSVLGVPLALTDYGPALDWIARTIERRERGSISRPYTP